MGYICIDCGEQDSFEGRQQVTSYSHETIYTDGEGDVQDYGDDDVYDSEAGDSEITNCRSCGSEDIPWELDEENIEEILENIRLRVEKNEQSSRLKWKKEIGD